jgi:hypothetical protein
MRSPRGSLRRGKGIRSFPTIRALFSGGSTLTPATPAQRFWNSSNRLA